MNGIIRIVYYSIDEGEEGRVVYKGSGFGVRGSGCTCQQKLDTKLKKLGIKIEYLYKIQ